MKNKKNILLKFIILLFIIVLIFLLSIYFFFIKNPTSNKVFNNTINSVVEFKSSTGDYFSYGTAVFIGDDGTLVTNAHVVTYKQSGMYKEFETYEIRFSYDVEYKEVELIRYDLDKDLAILKLIDTNSNYKSIKIGDSSKISVGDIVYAIGNGMNHGIGINKGIVSLKGVNITYNDYTRNVIQCDLIINEGNSGGALVDKRGKLIGITTFRLKDNSGDIIYGIAYAIPINEVMEYLNN